MKMKQYLKQLAVFLICVSAFISIAADKAAVAPAQKTVPAIASKPVVPPVPAPVDIVIPFTELGITKDDVECDAPSEKRCVLKYSVPSIGSDDKVEIDLDTAAGCSATETAIVCKGMPSNSTAAGVIPALSAALVAEKKADAKTDGALFYKLGLAHELADRAEMGAMLDAVASEIFAQAAKTKTPDQKIFELQWELADRANKWRAAETAMLQAAQKTSAAQGATAKGSASSTSEKSSATKASGDANRVQTQTAQSQVVVGTSGVTAKAPAGASQTSGIKQEAMQPTGGVPPLRDRRQMDDRLAEHINNQNKKVHYDYDALGRLVLRGGVGTEKTKTRIGYFGEMRTVEYNKDYPVSKIEYFNGQRGTEYIVETSKDAGNTIANVAAGYALHKDRLGSTAVVTSEKTGEVVERADYDPFGTTIVRGKDGKDADRSRIANSILYTGQYYDADAGLYLFRFRAYDPKIGKFLQRDPLGYSDGPNPTAYVMNSPHNFVDPLGLERDKHDVDYIGSGCITCGRPDADLSLRLMDNLTHPALAVASGIDFVANAKEHYYKSEVAKLQRNGVPSELAGYQAEMAADTAFLGVGSTAGLVSLVAVEGLSAAVGMVGEAASVAKAGKLLVKNTEKKITARIMEKYGLNENTYLYRWTEPQYVENGIARANPNSMAKIGDAYSEGIKNHPSYYSLREAKDLKTPGLNVASDPVSIIPFQKPNRVLIRTRLGDVENIRIYEDVLGMRDLGDNVFYITSSGPIPAEIIPAPILENVPKHIKYFGKIFPEQVQFVPKELLGRYRELGMLP